MKMAIGGVVPMADGFTPMGSDRAAIVPPNTMRLIGDRPFDDGAFIPINNSGVSQAILTERRRGWVQRRADSAGRPVLGRRR